MEQKRLGDIATYINGFAFKPEDRGTEGLPIIRIQDLTGNSYDLGFYDGEYPERIEINDGDVLISWSASLGVYIWNRGKALLNQHIFKVTFDKCEVNKPYFVYAVQHKLKEMESKTHGATMKHIVKKDFDNTIIPFPSLEKQAEIADVLDKVSSIIVARQRELQKLDELVKARFVEMFGDPIDNTKKLPVEQFSRCCLDMHQGINTVADKVEYQSVGYPIIQSKNITKGYLDLLDVRYLTDKDYLKYHEKYNPKVNDMLICNIGTIGKSLIIKEEQDFLIAWNLFLVKLNLEKVKPDYIKVFVEFLNDRHYYDQFLTGGTVKFVNKKTMGNIPVILPPMELQNQFADFVKQLDKSKFAIQKALDEAQVLFDSLMQKYFG